MLLLAGCGIMQAQADDRFELRRDIKTVRLGSGVSEETFWQEVRLLDADWWNHEAGKRFRAAGEPRGSTAGYVDWPSLWPERLLLVRAQMLQQGRSESDVVERLRVEEPVWYARWARITAEHPALAMGVGR
jgi:hypothetical protein